MTTSFSKKLRNGALLAILGLGLIAIVITGFGTGGSGGLGGVSGGQQAQAVLTVEGEELTDIELSRRMNFAYQQAVRQQPDLDREQFFTRNFDAMLEDLTDSRALRAFARKIGLVVPQSMVDREIVTNPAFQNVAGQYDDAAFRRFLSQERISEQQIRSDIETAQLIRMVTNPVGGAARVPQAVALEYANLLLETRTGQLGAVPTAVLARGLQPSEQEIAAFYQRNQRLFLQPERRVVRFALIGREQLGDSVRASDQEIQAYYQENQAQYGPGETRSLYVFTTQDQAAAQRLADRVRGGTSFVEAARAEGFAAEDISFPNQRREQAAQTTSPEMAEAIFAAQQGGVVGPTRTSTGIKVAGVQAINRTPGRPLAAVRAEIVTAIEQRKLAEQINSRVEQMDERLADGASFEEVAREAGLQVQTTPPITAAGTAPNFQFPPALAPLVTAAFEIDPDGDPEVQVVVPDQQMALVQVANVLPPAAPPLEQIRDQVRERLVLQTAQERGKAIAEGIVSRINGGMAPAQAYAQAGMTLPAAETITARRFQIARSGQQVPPPLTILFSIPEGRARLIAAPNNAGWIIVHHQKRVAGNAGADPAGTQIAATTQQELSESVERELQAQFARAVRSIVRVERKEEAINALRERLRTGN